MPKLIITETTKRTSFNIGGAPIIVNQEYDLSLASTIEIINTFGYPSEPMDFFKYKIKNDNIVSTNEATVKISFDVDITTLPLYYNLNKVIAINESFLFSDLIPGSNNYDRIIINSIEGKGLWLLSGIPIEIGQVLFYYQIYNDLTFSAVDSGSKPNYNSLKFQFGHKSGFWEHENSIDINTISLAELSLGSEIVAPELEDTIESLEYDLNVLNGPENGTYQLRINTTGFTGIGAPAENKIIITNNEIETVYNTAGIFTFDELLSLNGSSTLQFRIERLYPYATDVSILIDLMLINGETSGINTDKDNIVLIVPKSITT